MDSQKNLNDFMQYGSAETERLLAKKKPRKVFEPELSPVSELLAQKAKADMQARSAKPNRYSGALDLLIKQ